MPHLRFNFRLVAFTLSAFLGSSFSAVNADVRLPSVFSDHMVLQQQLPIRVWGWADQGESVDVRFAGSSATATPNESGRWQVELPPMDANATAQTLVVKGNNTVEVKDVLIGEVWLCSGQSNMEWTVARSSNAEQEIAAANFPLIRQIAIPKTPEFLPRNDVPAQWRVCSPETAGSFTACGYFMARNLHQELNVPIGLLNSPWGGTRVEPWTPPVGFERVDALQDIYRSIIGRTPGTDAYNEKLTAHITATADWIENAKQAQAAGELLTANPAYPTELTPFKSHQDPTMLFNGMIHPILGFPIRGAIWYQGESNHGEGMLYLEKKKALIGGWRELWQQGDFPFYFVQIAPYQYGNEDPEILARFWEAQAAVAQQVPNTGMVVINDIATIGNIHPPGKQEVGRRLALLALKNDYGRKDLVAVSPEMESLEVLDGRLRVLFKNTGGGLKTRDGKSPTHFEIIGPGSAGFQTATAQIDGDAVILSSDKVKEPVAFRFAWHKTAEPNLCGGTGLPVGAVRGGELPDFVSTLPIGDEYQVVYDLDLSKLGPNIQYDTDNSDSVTSFDRVGYLLELVTNSGEQRTVFVSMNAFTNDVTKIGIPTISSGAHFQCSVDSLDVFTNVDGITTGSGIATGNLEFWPNNYNATNAANVKGASSQTYDFGDAPSNPVDGYGSMQVHNHATKQTLFAINKWRAGVKADIGIGNSSGETHDWTFTSNADTYASKRLRVYVRTK
ncbi:sialate O-acetylesterase [Aporhodopirellula aestuarii]|uniref:Sialate O-acetylesterase n=1 Tax=Aporhodopirellula aestuarii TaxID=2950107 RepID=A0ABT0UAI3_9BACT|nr:sialate O-acetylesterase [Aporhodopirellula aestuarii]MCM2373874.1 sialate O-acetylesterase [Aporhodopirellula aestuarii]